MDREMYSGKYNIKLNSERKKELCKGNGDKA